MATPALSNWLGLCISCGCGENETAFGKGRSGQCNACYKKQWNKENRVKLRAQRLHGNAQKRAKANGWPVPNFDSLWIEEKILFGFCEVTGIKFDLDTQISNSVHAKNPWVPSLDRIDSSKPYTKDNVHLVVYMYNVCKAEFNHEDVIKFCKVVVSQELEIGN